MKIICNGEGKEIRANMVLKDFMLELGLNPDTVVAECDGRIVGKDEYETLTLSDGARLELIRFVGGG